MRYTHVLHCTKQLQVLFLKFNIYRQLTDILELKKRGPFLKNRKKLFKAGSYDNNTKANTYPP